MHGAAQKISLASAASAGSVKVEAVEHSLKRWSALAHYETSGTLPIYNNPVENSICFIAIVKKKRLFMGSERSGRRTAAFRGLFATAELNGLDPPRWLTILLERLPKCPNIKIDSLLPFPDFIQC